MPIVKVNTTVPSDSVPNDFHQQLTDIMYKALQKPKEVLYVDVRTGANMTMGGSGSPAVYATVECVGRLNPQSNLAMAKSMEDFFIDKLQVPRERIVIIFIPVPALFCSFNGALLDVAMEKDQDLPTSPSN